MRVTQADRVFSTVLVLDRKLDWWTLDDVQEIIQEHHEDALSRRTIRNRLKGLQEVDALEELGGRSRRYTRYRVSPELAAQ